MLNKSIAPLEERNPYDEIFADHESNVRRYCRSFPAVFDNARGSWIHDEHGESYLDFFSGAGALNYGHNHPEIKRSVIEYLLMDGIAHALDMHTIAKRDFLAHFVSTILAPRNLPYKVQFCAPTGADAVEAALKLACKITGRSRFGAFLHGYHGQTSACLSISSNERSKIGPVPGIDVTLLPLPETADEIGVSLSAVRTTLRSPKATRPAAIILETVQAEGGIRIAPVSWLQEIEQECRRNGVLLICDEVQVGCYRTGQFFSFERAHIIPDIVLLSKSIGGIGQPMSLLLMRHDLDQWLPGEHAGTFRGNQLAFVAGQAALKISATASFQSQLQRNSECLPKLLSAHITEIFPKLFTRGIGLIHGLDFHAYPERVAKEVQRRCFERKLIIELVGRRRNILKILPPLTITDAELEEGVRRIAAAVRESLP